MWYKIISTKAAEARTFYILSKRGGDMEEIVLHKPKCKYNSVGLHNLCYKIYYSMCLTWPQVLILFSFQDNCTWVETNHCHWTSRLKRGPRSLFSLFSLVKRYHC